MTDETPDGDGSESGEGTTGEGAEEVLEKQVGPSGGPGVPAAVKRIQGIWDEVIADMEATAAEYQENGWDVLQLHPGDVTAAKGREGGRWGLDVVIGGDEWAALETLVEEQGRTFGNVEVFRADAGGALVLLVALRDEDANSAVLCPVYYDLQEAKPMIERATEEGAMQMHIRPLDEREIYTFVHEDLELFLPGDE